jgi:antitoxin (DNA-binding transcriptional repressor) of toxin-antitoxin stability system
MDMRQYTASQAREHFAEILDQVEQGRSISITKHGAPVATIRRVDSAVAAPGWAKREGWSCKIAPGFDEIPEGFEEYI